MNQPVVTSNPVQLLSLNCFVLGSNSLEVFTVEILKTENISILKRLIKEKQSPRFNHVNASALILSQVSLPAVDDLEESLKNVDLAPLKPLLPLSQVFPRVEEDRLHVVVTVLGEPDMTHPAEKGVFPFLHCHHVLDDACHSAPSNY